MRVCVYILYLQANSPRGREANFHLCVCMRLGLFFSRSLSPSHYIYQTYPLALLFFSSYIKFLSEDATNEQKKQTPQGLNLPLDQIDPNGHTFTFSLVCFCFCLFSNLCAIFYPSLSNNLTRKLRSIS